MKYDKNGSWFNLNKLDKDNRIINENLLSKTLTFNYTDPDKTTKLEIDLTDMC